MKSKSVLYLILTTFVFGLALNQTILANFARDESRIFQKINAERQKRKLNTLDWDDDLARLARNYSRQMARYNFFSHYDRDGKTVVERATTARIGGWDKIGENLFTCDGFDEFDSIAVSGWMKSPTHRRNILDGSWMATGIGVAESRDGRIYITQVFIR